MPDPVVIEDKWNSIRQRFVFADSISNTANVIGDFFKNTDFNEPPKISIDLGKAESEYDYGTTSFALDMSWYARYKPTVDVFLSAWIWLVFLWRLYIKLPNIINGVGSDMAAVHSASETSMKRGGKL